MDKKNVYQYIQEQSVKSEAFRQQFLSDPKAVLEREFNIALPANITVQVYEDTPTDIHLVLPPRFAQEGVRSLSDEELAEAAGGMNCVTGHSGCSIPSLWGVFC